MAGNVESHAKRGGIRDATSPLPIVRCVTFVLTVLTKEHLEVREDEADGDEDWLDEILDEDEVTVATITTNNLGRAHEWTTTPHGAEGKEGKVHSPYTGSGHSQDE